MRKERTKKKVIFVGFIHKGKAAVDGETMKNQLLIRRLGELGAACRQIDLKEWRRHPWTILALFWDLLAHRDNTLLLSTTTQNIYPLLKLFYRTGWRQNIVYWVVGGILGQKVLDGTFDRKIIGCCRHILVQSDVMVEELAGCGVKGVFRIANCKPIGYYPDIRHRTDKEPGEESGSLIRFVFLSRIMPGKGSDDILAAARMLNEAGLENRYSIDFYGPVNDAYRAEFLEKVGILPNVSYKGFLNLQENAGYDTLAGYDVMLFPTYWPSEGFAGVFIDAFISGVPLIVSEWAYNREFLKEGETALFVPARDAAALQEKMLECMEGKHDLARMARACQREAEQYKIERVVTEDLLRKIEIL